MFMLSGFSKLCVEVITSANVGLLSVVYWFIVESRDVIVVSSIVVVSGTTLYRGYIFVFSRVTKNMSFLIGK